MQIVRPRERKPPIVAFLTRVADPTDATVSNREIATWPSLLFEAEKHDKTQTSGQKLPAPNGGAMRECVGVRGRRQEGARVNAE